MPFVSNPNPQGQSADLFIGIDFGTSGCRAIAIDSAARIVAQAAVDLPNAPREGLGHTQDPLIWWQALEQVLDTLLRDLDRRRVSALAIDGTSATLLLTDATGTPLGPALLYDDARATDAAARIVAVAPPDSATRSATSSLAKLLYLLDQPGYALARHALHQADWIAGRLMGRYTHSDENNCLKLGYDPVAGTWPAWLATLGIDPALLPWPTAPGKAIGLLSEPVAQRFGLSTQVRVVAGTTDSTAAFIATGAQNPGDAVTSLGSTLVVKVLSTQPVFAPEYGVYSHRLDDRWLVGGASNSGGAVLRQYFTPAQIDALTQRLNPATPTGLDYYPLCGTGERFPSNDPELKPRLTPRPDDDAVFFQGMLEGIARIEQRGYELLHRLGAPYPTSVRSVGGGAGNKGWTQIRASLLGVPMLTPAQTQAAYGATLLALQGNKM